MAFGLLPAPLATRGIRALRLAALENLASSLTSPMSSSTFTLVMIHGLFISESRLLVFNLRSRAASQKPTKRISVPYHGGVQEVGGSCQVSTLLAGAVVPSTSFAEPVGVQGLRVLPPATSLLLAPRWLQQASRSAPHLAPANHKVHTVTTCKFQ